MKMFQNIIPLAQVDRLMKKLNGLVGLVKARFQASKDYLCEVKAGMAELRAMVEFDQWCLWRPSIL